MLTEFQAQIPDPLREDLKEFLPTAHGMRNETTTRSKRSRYSP